MVCFDMKLFKNGCLKRKIDILSEDELQKTHRYVPAPIRARMGMGSLAALNACLPVLGGVFL